jgi:hypothetical protein
MDFRLRTVEDTIDTLDDTTTTADDMVDPIQVIAIPAMAAMQHVDQVVAAEDYQSKQHL